MPYGALLQAVHSSSVRVNLQSGLRRRFTEASKERIKIGIQAIANDKIHVRTLLEEADQLSVDVLIEALAAGWDIANGLLNESQC